LTADASPQLVRGRRKGRRGGGTSGGGAEGVGGCVIDGGG